MYLSTRTLANRLGVNIRTIQRWIANDLHFEDGDLIRVGKRYRIRPEAFDRLVDKFSDY